MRDQSPNENNEPRVLAAAAANGHAGEILQGALRRDGRVHRVLCSLPAPGLRSLVTLVRTPGRAMSVHPFWARRSLAAARRFASSEGELAICIDSNIPVAKGCGSSTADVVATLRAMSLHLGTPISEFELARLAVEAEQASDSTMLSTPSVFRHREGIVDQLLPNDWPAMHVIVVDTQPAVTVDTLELERVRYTESQLHTFACLTEQLRSAFSAGDARGIGVVATASARINQQHLPKPHLEDYIDLVAREGGYGVAAAHSGTSLALLFATSNVAAHRRGPIAFAAHSGMRILAEYTLSPQRQPKTLAPPPAKFCYSGMGAPQEA